MFSFVPYAADCLEKFRAHSALVDCSYTLAEAFEANSIALFHYYEMKIQQMSLFQFYSYIDGSLHVSGPLSTENSHQDRPQHTEHATRTVQVLKQWLCEQLCELS